MSATIQEVLMALGAVSIDFDPDPEIYAELVKGPAGEERDGRALVIRWAEFPEAFGCVKVGHVPSRDVITAKAVGLEWYLGSGDVGPTAAVEKVYVAGNNKLANPKFLYTFTEETTDNFGDPTTRVTADSWKLADKTGWLIAPGSATVTNVLRDELAGLGALDTAISLPSDILTSDESFPVLAGELWKAIVSTHRPTAVGPGRLRDRLVLDGHFRHPNVLPALTSWSIDPDTVSGDAHIFTTGTKRVEIGPVTRETRLIDTGWSDTSEFVGDVVTGPSWLTIGPCTQPETLHNTGFESGDLTDWDGTVTTLPTWVVATSEGSILPYSGSYMVVAYVGNGYDAPAGYLTNSQFATVKEGERYAVDCPVREGSAPAVGEAGLFLIPVPVAGGSPYQPSATIRGSDYYGTTALADTWKSLRVEYTVPPLVVALGVTLFAQGDPTVGGKFCFDEVTLTRIGGNTCQAAGISFSVVAQDTYEVTSQAFANPNMTQGSLDMAVTMTGAGMDPITVKATISKDNKSLTLMKATITPDDGYTDAYITFNGSDVVGDSFVANFPLVVRTVGNTAKVDCPAISVVPEESFTIRALVTADATITQGTIGVSFLCKGTGRPDQVIDGPAFEASDITPRGIEFPFATPSGYDAVLPFIVGTDILGGKFTVGVPTMALTDNKRLALDLAVAPPVDAVDRAYRLDITVPFGAANLHGELVAEDQADGFVVTQLNIGRAETPVTSGDVARDCLTDPDTGVQLVAEGNIVGDEAIQWDWDVANQHQRDKLQHLSRSGLAIPVREWRFYLDAVTGKPTVDWGVPPAIFADRTDLVFVDDDLKVIDEPQVEHDATGRVTKVRVVGADRERPDGPPIQITGEATNDNADFLDWDANPLTRTKTVSDTSATHPDYAAALARYDADIAAVPAENVRVQVADWRAWALKGPFRVGDWVYVYKPAAGIFDLANPMQYEGRTVWPKKLRVISRTWRLGAGDFHLEIHRPGLEPFDVDDALVLWEAETTAELELGDPLPEFQPDEQGGPALDQLRRLRSMPKR